MNPDALVASHGEDVTLSRVTTAVYNAHNELDVDASTIETPTIKAIFSQPREQDLLQLQGREARRALRATVASTTDVQRSRPGRPDEITRAGITYRVVEVNDDQHPSLGARKKTVLLEELPGA